MQKNLLKALALSLSDSTTQPLDVVNSLMGNLVRVYMLPKTFKIIYDIASKFFLKVTSQLSSKRLYRISSMLKSRLGTVS